MTAWTRHCQLMAGLLLAGSALGAQWFPITAANASTDSTELEIDLDSLRIQTGSGEGVIRVTYDVLQPHPSGFGYRSFVATAQFDCGPRTIVLNSAAYFALPAGQGQRLGTDATGRDGGIPPRLLESIPGPARTALLKATCATPSSN